MGSLSLFSDAGREVVLMPLPITSSSSSSPSIVMTILLLLVELCRLLVCMSIISDWRWYW
jgi:hypothetical protein